MNRGLLPILLIAIFAGAAAGAAISLALMPPAPSTTEPAATGAADARLADLTDALARLELRLAEIDLANSEVTSRMNRLEESGTPREASPDVAMEDALAEAGVNLPGGRSSQVRLGGAPMISFGSGKGAQLMSLPEEEKWNQLREELALDSYQESELKRIQEEMQAEIKDIFEIDPETGTLAAKLDIPKMMEARRNADEKVKNLLSGQQYEKFRKEGYGSALGMGGGIAVSYTSISTPRDRPTSPRDQRGK